MLLAPVYSFPSKMSPAPKPVPKVRNTMLWQPRPAPKRHSARAQASASFCRRQGTPKAWEKSSAAGI